jgi:DNA-binding IclR family transcriptional regulator
MIERSADQTARMSAARKVLAVLGSFDRDRSGQSLTQISRRAGLPLSTTHRIVTDLAGWGALERTSDGAWHIGLRLWELATSCPRGQLLREVALPFMQDLYERTHENVQIAVREGTELVFVERIAGHHSVDLLTRVADRFPLASTGMGRVLLAFSPVDIQEAVLSTPLHPATSFTVTDPDRLREELARIRREHYTISDRQLSEDTVAIAAPVRIGAKGPVHAVLGIILSADRRDTVRRLRDPLLHAARGISVHLGAHSDDAVN